MSSAPRPATARSWPARARRTKRGRRSSMHPGRQRDRGRAAERRCVRTGRLDWQVRRSVAGGGRGRRVHRRRRAVRRRERPNASPTPPPRHRLVRMSDDRRRRPPVPGGRAGGGADHRRRRLGHGQPRRAPPLAAPGRAAHRGGDGRGVRHAGGGAAAQRLRRRLRRRPPQPGDEHVLHRHRGVGRVGGQLAAVGHGDRRVPRARRPACHSAATTRPSRRRRAGGDGVVAGFFTSLVLFVTPTFEAAPRTVSDGSGANPLFRTTC